ncbi:hypothetical protein GCM10010495_36750 [Kitasatospora herbaricolor]|nr:hypothetical protein [Kitasatospora herbaricolor]GGV18632.1 hypothetical protein GCM10010495_36750 [Kitasatospora herbaricolor]
MDRNADVCDAAAVNRPVGRVADAAVRVWRTAGAGRRVPDAPCPAGSPTV